MADQNEKMITFVGFQPDFDPLTPGIWLDCDGLLGTMKGFRPEPGEQFAYDAIGGTFLLYDRDDHLSIYAVTFTDFITISSSSGLAVGGIQLNGPWQFFIQGGVARYGNEPFADVVPWSNIRPFLVNEDDPELQLNYG